ncbi:prolipoprotein diacylglyceryl transferase [uncultured Helicobacter sp.]|uniref:prolipoprotein diacylglyceryl transferase n=1 Tax=uncultured Helicobacter sp. TaxID=175537 RepID=UPI00374F1105
MREWSAWNLFYTYFDPIAFEIFGFKVHWYGLCYVGALLLALFIASFLLKRFKKRFNIESKYLESYFLWAELGVILGARIGYLFIYGDSMYYLMHPWQIFNPVNAQGEFVGIAGFSYHGGVIGFLLATILFCVIKQQPILRYLDLATFSIPLAYVLGRIGNFLNHELFGRVIDSDSALAFLGVLVNGELRYPSQLFEAFLEGIVVFVLMAVAFRFCNKDGYLSVVYGLGYALARFVCEFFREADSQMGYYGSLGLSMGQILSIIMFVGAGILFFVIYTQTSPNPRRKQCKK